MNLLITNDDGIESEGIVSLSRELSIKHNVIVIAPNSNMTASGHSLTIGKSLFLKKHDIGGSIEAYSLSGTPADCVKFADNNFKDFKIDLVVSGINKGANLGSDVVYSGTLSAALEGVCLCYPSVAFSSCADEDNKFDVCAGFASEIIDNVLDFSVKGIAWNVNFPNVDRDKVNGIKFTQTGIQLYSDLYETISDNEFVLKGHPIEHNENEQDCDVELIKLNYITITPILFNKTDYKTLEKLKNKNREFRQNNE